MHLHQRIEGSRWEAGGTAGVRVTAARYAMMAVLVMLVPAARVLIGLGLQSQINNPNSHQKAKRIPNPKCLLGGKCCETALLSAQEDFKSTRPACRNSRSYIHPLSKVPL